MEHFDRRKVADLAQMLLQLSDSDLEDLSYNGGVSARSDRTLATVREEQARRKSRHKLLGVSHDVFSDPGWDLLLELYVAKLTGVRLASSTIGLDAEIPQSTALRWLTYLSSLGLVVRTQDPSDKRRQLVELSTRACSGLKRCFA